MIAVPSSPPDDPSPGAMSPLAVAKAGYHGLVNALQLVDKEIQPVLFSQLELNDRENLVRTLWLRVYMWLKCLADLNERHHLQGIMASARGLFELTVDLTLIHRDPTSTPVQRFLAFEEYQQWRDTERVREYCAANPNDSATGYLQAICAQFPRHPQRQAEIVALQKAHWGYDRKGKPRKPETWTGCNVAANCRAAQMEREHVEMYGLLCASIHSGIHGFFGLLNEDFERHVCLTYLFALRMVLRAIDIVSAEFKLSGAIPEFREKMDWVESLPGRYLNRVSAERRESPNNLSSS